MTAFFRVQNENGTGMYSSITAEEHLYELDTKHPSTNLDTKLIEALGIDSFWDYPNCERFRFGFTSIEQTLHWIYQREWLASLKEEGFALYEYDCPIFAGNTPAVADVSTMGRPTQIHDLTTLF